VKLMTDRAIKQPKKLRQLTNDGDLPLTALVAALYDKLKLRALERSPI
jgi:hypothetical protein